MTAPTVTHLIIQFLIRRVMNGNFFITSHELENEGRKFIERELGKTVNPSTISRKWRLLKQEYVHNDSGIQLVPFGEDRVIVKTLRKGKDGNWDVLNILGEDANHIYSASKMQMELNFKESQNAEDQAQCGS